MGFKESILFKHVNISKECADENTNMSAKFEVLDFSFPKPDRRLSK